jgi:putative drug exporter of the RND superfamily
MLSQGGSMRWIVRLGGFASRHARTVVLCWLAAAALATLGAGRLPDLLFSGGGDIPDSQSLRVDRLLRREFIQAHAQLLVLAVRSPSLDREPAAAATLLQALEVRLRQSPLVAEVLGEDEVLDRRLRPLPGTGHAILISLNAADVRQAEQGIPRLRTAVAPLLQAAKARHPDLVWATTGRAALNYDLNQFNARDTTQAELRALPLTLLILIFAFGSLVAAGLPLLLGGISASVTLGLVYCVATSIILSNLVQNVASMIGLAVGIDYTLFLVYRYREEVRRLQARHETLDRTQRQQLALERTLASAGTAVFISGLTVLIGMGGLLATPLLETRSLGFGGCVVVSVAVAASLTLLPALLTLIGPVLLEWPEGISRRVNSESARRRWQEWAGLVMRRPVAAASLSLAALLWLAWPGVHTRFGFPEGSFLPAELEFTRGMDLLSAMNLKGLLSPLPVVLTDTAGEPALTTARVSTLLAFSGRLRRDVRVAVVQGPVDLADDWPPERYAMLYADVDAAFAMFPQIRAAFVSRDKTRLLINVFPTRECTLEDTKALARAIPAWFDIPGMRLDLGGQPVYYNDFDVSVKAAYGWSVGLVLLFTCVVLLLAFCAPLVAFKALVLNALSVLAGYGVVVYVFQQGHGSAWLGVAAPTEVVPLTIPLLVFCILFGLSMDYEVFLLTRARAAFQRSGDNTASVSEALAATGSIITSAALVMIVVFGAFALARVVLVQMLGLGLAVAVLVDATLIRCLLGPALMCVAGSWNWWPGAKRPAPLLGSPGRSGD